MSDVRSKFIKVRVTPQEQRVIQAKANRTGTTISEIMRRPIHR